MLNFFYFSHNFVVFIYLVIVLVILIQDYLYRAFYDTIVAKQLHRKLSF